MAQTRINEAKQSNIEEDQIFQLAAEALVHEAYVRGSTDNIGVCVVALSGDRS